MMKDSNGFGFWQSQRETLRKLYYDDGLSTNDIGRMYGVYGETISYNMNRMGFVLRKVGTSDRINAKYSVDSFFFDNIDSESKAYILGFIISDGHVSKNNSLMISLHQKDRDTLERINEEMSSTYPIHMKRNYVSLVISSKVLCNALRSFGLDNRKTFTLKMETVVSHVPQLLHRH